MTTPEQPRPFRRLTPEERDEIIRQMEIEGTRRAREPIERQRAEEQKVINQWKNLLPDREAEVTARLIGGFDTAQGRILRRIMQDSIRNVKFFDKRAARAKRNTPRIREKAFEAFKLALARRTFVEKDGKVVNQGAAPAAWYEIYHRLTGRSTTRRRSRRRAA